MIQFLIYDQNGREGGSFRLLLRVELGCLLTLVSTEGRGKIRAVCESGSEEFAKYSLSASQKTLFLRLIAPKDAPRNYHT